MIVLVWTVIALEAIGGILAAWVARRDREHRLIAAAILATCGAELLRYALLPTISTGYP